jgi:ribonuclease R
MEQHRKHEQHQHSKEVKDLSELTGTIRINSRGFGYVDTGPGTEDVEIPPELLNTALHLDTVRIAPHPKRRQGRMRGEVLEVLTRAKTRFVGVLEEENGFVFFKPDDHKCYIDFIIERTDTTEVPKGQKVAVELVRWSSPKKNPLARIVEVLGPVGLHETEMRSIVAGQGFDWNFPDAVVQESERLERDKERFFAQEIERRRDFRSVPTFTIDPADAKDFDDAISVRTLENGHIEIGVHIADVSAYMQRGSAMDEEAQKRGTSIYLVDRTIPMLPEALSNDLCSLVPHQDRLAFSAVFEMSLTGEVFDRWFGEVVINSDRRFSYADAQAVLTKGEGDLVAELTLADTIARALREQRFAHGSIGFETDEIKFELDETGKPIRAFRKERLDTMLMIEDLMLLANREVATWIGKKCETKGASCVFVWRIHDSPKPERIIDLALFLKVLGYELPNKNGIVTAQAINELFKEVTGKPEQSMIETAAIRSMAKAIYSTKNIGHFGLAFDYYTHFTSPIRRYPDVMVHRIVKSHLAGTPFGTREYAWHERLCAKSSEREVAAMEAERDSIKLKQVEYLAGHIGDLFDGVVSGINDWGIFIEEQTTMAEGLVRVSTMRDDFYELTDHGYRLVGARTKKTISLGDKVRVRLAGVDIERKTIDWNLV